MTVIFPGPTPQDRYAAASTFAAKPPATLYQIGSRAIDLADPPQHDLEPAFLVPRLAGLARFSGQAMHAGGRCWSVADHTAAVLSLLHIRGWTPETHPELQIAAALHDVHELFTADIPSPFKALLESHAPGALDRAEAGLRARIGAAGGLPPAYALDWFERAELVMADRDCGLAEGLAFLPRIGQTADYWERAPENARNAVRHWQDRPAFEATGFILSAILAAQKTMAARGRRSLTSAGDQIR